MSRSNIQRMSWNPLAPSGPTISPSTSTCTSTVSRMRRTISAKARVEIEKYSPLRRRVRAPTAIAARPAAHAPMSTAAPIGSPNIAVAAPAA